MHKKFALFLASALFLVLTLSVAPVLAKNDNGSGNDYPPEVEGIHDVPGRPELKVRVHIYRPKPVKPDQSASPSLICSLPDPDSATTVGSTGWHLPSGDWVYRLNTSSTPSSVGNSNLPVIAQNVYNSWKATEAGNSVNFVRGANTNSTRAGLDGQNIIAWGRSAGTALAITYTWYYQDSGVVAENDTIMNTRVKWSWTQYNSSNICADSNSYDAQNILNHEVGHWVGLNDMYDFVDFGQATMYGYGAKGEVKKDTLTSGDAAGVSAIY